MKRLQRDAGSQLTNDLILAMVFQLKYGMNDNVSGCNNSVSSKLASNL